MFNVDYDVVEELDFGINMRMRLIESHRGKQSIQIWSSISNAWSTMYRYNVQAEWAKWKIMAARLNDQSAFETLRP